MNLKTRPLQKIDSNKLLVVDDNPSMQLVIENAFAREGYVLQTAANGREALELVDSFRPDLVLMDVMMPMLNGFDTCRAIRANPKHAEIPVILFTALTDRQTRLEGIAAGADEFLNKPVDIAELRLRVSNVLKLNRFKKIVHHRAQFETMFDLSPDGIILADRAGVIHLANRAAQKITRETLDSLQGKPMAELAAPAQQAEWQEFFASVFENSVPSRGLETWLARRNGENFPAEIHAARLNLGVEPMAQFFIRDISDWHQLSAIALDAQEAERRNLAQELHDEVGQILTGVKMNLEQAERGDDSEPGRKVGFALEEVSALLDRVRGMALQLRPRLLDDLGLVPAVELLAEQFFKSSGFRVDFKHAGLKARYPEPIETAAYRMIQDALNNSLKHGGVTEAQVRLWEREGFLEAQVEDKGSGFAIDKVKEARSMGLSGIRERAALLGGVARVDSMPGAGTSWLVSLPLGKIGK